MSFSRTHTIEFNVPAAAVFDVVSNVEHLPDWATAFCKRIIGRDGTRYRIDTPAGPLVFWIDANPSSGVIDMRGGPTEEAASYWPTRVIDGPEGRSVFVFTAFRSPGMSEEQFEGQCTALGHELQSLKALIEARRLPVEAAQRQF